MKASFWTELLDIISPRQCAICGERLSATEQVICGACHLQLPLTHYEQSPLDNPLARLFWGLFPVERAAAFFFYEPQSAASHLVYSMKYFGRREVAEAMGTIIARRFMAAGFFDGIDVLLPMPITRRRRWQRGYNQSHELARGISQVSALPIADHVVKRVNFTQSQTTRHAWERLHGVDNAFRLVKPEAIANRHVLLIDDIVTTGATISSCARELAKAPGVRISVLALGVTRS